MQKCYKRKDAPIKIGMRHNERGGTQKGNHFAGMIIDRNNYPKIIALTTLLLPRRSTRAAGEVVETSLGTRNIMLQMINDILLFF
jgi:hypothetical protein